MSRVAGSEGATPNPVDLEVVESQTSGAERTSAGRGASGQTQRAGLGGSESIDSVGAQGETASGEEIVDLYIRSFAPFFSFGGGFHGDDRSFSTDLEDSSRISGKVTINVSTREVGTSSVVSSPTFCVGMPCGLAFGTKVVRGTPTISAEKMDASTIMISVAGSNPMVPLSPNIDLELKLTISTTGEMSGVLVGDAFPNAEVFTVDENGRSKMLLTLSTDGGPMSGPGTYLPGNNKRPMGSFP